MLEMMFNEPQLLIVYRVALEIELVYAPSPEQREELPRLTVDDMIAMAEDEAMTNEDHDNPVHPEEGIFIKSCNFFFKYLALLVR